MLILSSDGAAGRVPGVHQTYHACGMFVNLKLVVFAAVLSGSWEHCSYAIQLGYLAVMSLILSSNGAAGRSLCCQRHIPWWATVALTVAGLLVLPIQALDILLAMIQLF